MAWEVPRYAAELGQLQLNEEVREQWQGAMSAAVAPKQKGPETALHGWWQSSMFNTTPTPSKPSGNTALQTGKYLHALLGGVPTP